jgi:RNA polymerase sigma factor (sigma-70 family)
MLFEVMSDEHLRAVLGELLCQHHERWQSLVRRFVGNPADAEDVIQEAARRLLERPPQFGSVEEIQMYLRRTVRNTAIEAYRARRRNQRRQVRLVEHRAVCRTDETPEVRLEAQERSEHLRRMGGFLQAGLRSLPADQYKAVVWTILGNRGSSIRGVGARAGIPYSTLRHRTARGLRQLRRFIERAQRIAGAAPPASGSRLVRALQ